MRDRDRPSFARAAGRLLAFRLSRVVYGALVVKARCWRGGAGAARPQRPEGPPAGVV